MKLIICDMRYVYCSIKIKFFMIFFIFYNNLITNFSDITQNS